MYPKSFEMMIPPSARSVPCAIFSRALSVWFMKTVREWRLYISYCKSFSWMRKCAIASAASLLPSSVQCSL